jgi:hypothetical protein
LCNDARGGELAVTAQPHRRLNLSTSYTFTNAVNRTPTSVPGFLPSFTQPRHIFTLVAAHQITRQFDVVFDMFAYGSYFFPFAVSAFRFGGPVKADLAGNYTRPLTERITLRFYGKGGKSVRPRVLRKRLPYTGDGLHGRYGIAFLNCVTFGNWARFAHGCLLKRLRRTVHGRKSDETS